MVALNNIRNRLKGVENIKQIATSMEMLASARLRGAQDKAKKAQFYVARLREILVRLENAATDFTHPLLERREVKTSGVVIVSSDRGLCGAYNSRIFAAADSILKDNSQLILVGRKAIAYYQNKKYPIFGQWGGWSGKTTYSMIQNYTQELLDAFLTHKLDEVWLVYTQFHNLMNQEVAIEKFLPIIAPEASSQPPLNYLFEPDLEQIYTELLPRYCTTKMETMLSQAHASELAARIFAMKTAAQNAEEMLDNLTLERNKVRQSTITRELLETTTP